MAYSPRSVVEVIHPKRCPQLLAKVDAERRGIYRSEAVAPAPRHVSAKGGVLLIQSPVPLDEWEAACARQQAPHREYRVDEPVAEYRTRTATAEGLTVERVLPGDLPG